VNKLHSTGADCHGKTGSHLIAFVAHNTSQHIWTNQIVLLDNEKSAILALELQLWKKILVTSYVLSACFGHFVWKFPCQSVFFVMCKLWELTLGITTDACHSYEIYICSSSACWVLRSLPDKMSATVVLISATKMSCNALHKLINHSTFGLNQWFSTWGKFPLGIGNAWHQLLGHFSPYHPWRSICQVPWKRSLEIIEPKVDDTQCCFHAGSSTTDKIFTLQQILHKSWECTKGIHRCFVDLKKTYDRVPCENFWGVLQEHSVGSHLLLTIKSLYAAQMCLG